METREPKISIITLTYNHEKYIAECIESVLAQTYSNWEMIIVNDGSTDNTKDIVESYMIKDSRIKLLNQKNLGIYKLGVTYNKGLESATGDYIAILEGDDYWEPFKLRCQMDIINKDKSIVMVWGKAASRVAFKKENYQVYPINERKNLDYYFNEPVGSIFNVVLDDFLPPLTYLIKKSSLIEIGGFIQIHPFPSIDLSTILELSKKGKFYYCNNILGTWRISSSQITKTFNNDILEGSLKILLQHYKSLSSSERELINVSEQGIIDNYKKRRIISYSRGGRFKLIRKDFKAARKDYLMAIKLYGITEPIWKLRALIGLLFSYLKLDVEDLAEWFGKGRIK